MARLIETLRAYAKSVDANPAVVFSLLTQAWSTVTGLATLLVIARWLTPVEQGYYYTFNSVLALQVFMELGLTTVIIQVASHEWARLKREQSGYISGDATALSRLASLLRFALRWYVIAGFAVMVGLGYSGVLFFSATPDSQIAWRGAWLFLCGAAGLSLMTSPLLSVMEGCNQIASIYSFRLLQGVLSSVAVIACVLLGYGVWALGAGAIVRLICAVAFVAAKHRVFIAQLLATPTPERIDWRTELWPFQWRIAVSWLCGYFIFSIFTPVMFHYFGPKVAGQTGMTLTLAMAIEALAYPWIGTRVPQFGILIARKQFRELDTLFRRQLTVGLGITSACAIIALGVVWWAQAAQLPIAARVLPPLALGMFLGQRVVNFGINAMAIYLRAHKAEPLMLPSLGTAVFVAASTFTLGVHYGPTGAAAGFLGVTTVWAFPACILIFQRCRAKWHYEPVEAKPRLTSSHLSADGAG